MNELLQTDAEMARNASIEVFTTNTGTKYTIRALSIDRADEWMAEAAKVEPYQRQVMALEKAVRDGDEEKAEALNEARRKYSRAMYSAVFAYDPAALPEEKIKAEGVTPSQMARAFMLMQQVNDPFVTATILQANLGREIVRGLPIGNGGTRK